MLSFSSLHFMSIYQIDAYYAKDKKKYKKCSLKLVKQIQRKRVSDR